MILKKLCLYVASVLVLVGLLFISGCGDEVNQSTYESVQDKLVNMKTYQCDAEIKYISNKNENSYTAKIYSKMSGEYRIETSSPKEVEGNIILFDGKMIWHYNPRVESKISVNCPDKPERKEVLLSSFVKNYVKSQNVAIETSQSDDEAVCTVLEAKVPEGQKYFDSEKLWVDNNSMLPVKLVVFDKDGNERIIVSFSDFVYNQELKDELFKMY